MPGSAQEAKQNLFTVASRHPHRAVLKLPTTEAELEGEFPNLVKYLPGSGSGKAWQRFFADADAAYTSSSSSFDFRVISSMLRRGLLPAERQEAYRKVVAKLMMGMDPLPPAAGTLYRGMLPENEPVLRDLGAHLEDKGLGAFSGYTGAKSFQDNGFISTSTSELAAGRFINGKPSGVLLIITLSPGARGRIPASKHRSEREVLLAPLTRFAVTSVSKGKVAGAGLVERYRFSVTASFG